MSHSCRAGSMNVTFMSLLGASLGACLWLVVKGTTGPGWLDGRRVGLGGAEVGEGEGAVRVEGEAGVPGDLPDVAVRVAEVAGVAAVEGLPGGPDYLGAGGGRGLQRRVDLLAGPEVLRQDDGAQVRVPDAAVGGELGPAPQD